MTEALPEQDQTLPVTGSGSSITHLRPVALSIFENERSTTPLKSGVLSWPSVIAMHSSHSIRDEKSGPMVASYNLSGTRNNQNVLARSYVQLDVDSDGEKDKVTGRLLKVTRSAPDFAAISPKIAKYEYVANSTHWHEPSIGANKFRIAMATDRDYLQDEHKPLLEALDELLEGCLDRDAWAWSQAFFAPSCPPHAVQDAFIVHNQGVPLPVDEFVARGRQIIAARQQLPAQPAPKVGHVQAQIPETPENVAIVRSMLAAIPASEKRKVWRPAVWAVHSLGWISGEQLTRDWSMTSLPDYKPADFNKLWSNYNPDRPDAIHFGTLERLAHAYGYSGPSVGKTSQFDGKGADVANGKLFADQNRNRLLHIHETGEWLQFDPRAGWLKAKPLEDERAAKAVVACLRADAARQLAAGVEEEKVRKLLRHVEISCRASNLRAMIDMAKSEPGMTRRACEFDADPMLLGLTNGVLDLRTGQLRAPAPDLLVSKRCNVAYDPSASCPRFELFMPEIQPDPDAREFLKRLVGTWLTGDSSAQVFAFLFGTGANGKSVFTELMAWLLGDYAQKIATELLMQHKRNPQGPSPDIVALKGVRLAYASETEEGQRFAAARVKEFTGGDTLSGRVPYGKVDISFQPTHKLVIVGNHKPEISDMSHGMWRRVMLIGFNETIPEAARDPHLLERLKGEAAGILNWALAGLQDWRKDGLKVPSAIKHATHGYREEQDIVGEWIDENCNVVSGVATLKGSLYHDYKQWAVLNGYQPMAKGRLTRRLGDRGYKLDPGNRNILGLMLKRGVGGQAH